MLANRYEHLEKLFGPQLLQILLSKLEEEFCGFSKVSAGR